jgi:hypothetical protein
MLFSGKKEIEIQRTLNNIYLELSVIFPYANASGLTSRQVRLDVKASAMYRKLLAVEDGGGGGGILSKSLKKNYCNIHRKVKDNSVE